VKYLRLSEIPWEKYKVIGFDMDGTLYNEECFIKQVYDEIANFLAEFATKSKSEIYIWMLQRWREKGSSYPYIFSETMNEFKICEGASLINECLNIYRNVKPDLHLHQNIVRLLDTLKQKKNIFLITDGNMLLQRQKFYSLALDRWFTKENVVFTGVLGSEYYKPHSKSLDLVTCITNNNDSVLYIGDRDIDENFAKNADFDFAKVDNFNDFWGLV
jgi:FMN phosphatase YigB (HAD superfamily)